MEPLLRLVTPHADIADRVETQYSCPSNHEFTMVFAAGIDTPSTWDCPRCGKPAGLQGDCAQPQECHQKRTHWDMLMERRSAEELDSYLKDRIKEKRLDCSADDAA